MVWIAALGSLWFGLGIGSNAREDSHLTLSKAEACHAGFTRLQRINLTFGKHFALVPLVQENVTLHVGYFKAGIFSKEDPNGWLTRTRKLCRFESTNPSLGTYLLPIEGECRQIKTSGRIEQVSWKMNLFGPHHEPLGIARLTCQGSGMLIPQDWTPGDVKYHLGEYFTPIFQDKIQPAESAPQGAGKIAE